MITHNQPGDVRVNRANLYRRVGRVCFADGPEVAGLPAPRDVEFLPSGNMWLTFDSFEQAATWAERYKLRLATEQVYKAKHLGTWCGEFEGQPVTVNGSTPVDETAPEDTDPDDLSEPQSIEDVAPPAPVLDRHIALANSGDDRDGYTPPGGPLKPGIEGTTVNGSLAFSSLTGEGGTFRRWDLTGRAGLIRFETTEAGGNVVPTMYIQRPTDDYPSPLSNQLAHELLEQWRAAEDDEVLREGLERAYATNLEERAR